MLVIVKRMYAGKHNRRGVLGPDVEMWRALREGEGLYEILEDFYERVYEDSRLSVFFQDFTKQRAIEKQYLFLRSIFTGEKIYFGERPKNAHHWMVISNDLFDYRETLMEQCLRRYGLAEKLIQKWRAVEETFRKAIVKDKPMPKKIGGITVPVEGYADIELAVASLCDNCEAEILSGMVVKYHQRTGKIFCKKCAPEE